MATAWPTKRRLIGTEVRRLDGPDKATGKARYSFDINRPGMLHAIILRCPYAHAKVVQIDAMAAEKMPGVKAIHPIAEEGKELYYAGDEVIALAADTEEHARDAIRAIKVKYEQLEFFVNEDDALKDPEKKTIGGDKIKSNVNLGGQATKGDVEAGFKSAEAIIEASYGVPVICHQCL